MLDMSGTRKRATGNSGGSQNLRPWVKGQSGNPSGRPRGIASAVKERVNPEELVDLLLSVARDERSKAPERIAAVRELADRGWGKAPAFAAIEGSDPLELDVIAQEIQGIADELRARREGRTIAGPEGPAAEPASASG